MTAMRTFIRENRADIDQAVSNIRNRGRTIPINELKYTDKDRYEWILNDYDLYHWAKREGAPI